MARRRSDKAMDDSELDTMLTRMVADGWDVDAPPSNADGSGPTTVLEPQLHGGALMRTRSDPEDEGGEAPPKPLSDIGLLAELATGRKTVEQVAQASGLTTEDIQKHLAVSLRQVPPEEIAKAMGAQAAQQQLVSGALYGTVLANLVDDMVRGRLKPEHKLELARVLARVGRVEPKEDKGAATGSGFVLNINLGAQEKTVVVEAQPVGDASEVAP